nr:integrase, catalytic region, zinc finger, CCHC-type, peptidase aspartic, catalytic [Tanacetum cinerariifolium]
MQTQTSNTLHNAIMESGSKDRPPMLAPGNYVQLKSRIKRYIDTKPNYELIHYCLDNPPYKLDWKDVEVPVSEGSPITTTTRIHKTYKNVSQDIRDQLNAEAKAVQIILTGIDNDIYSTVDACPNACEMWKAIERLKQGKSINVQDLETNLYWEFGKFTSQDDAADSGPIFDDEPLQKLIEIVLFIVDSGYSKHMTENLKLLINFVEKFLGTVKFGNDQIARILGYGDLVQGAVTIKRVYYVEGLNHYLFSVGQFCDADLEVTFRKPTCFIRDLKGNDLLTGSRGTDLYSITLQDTNSPYPICLMAKATSSQAWLWHRRLSHLNFDTINLLSKNDIVNSSTRSQQAATRNREKAIINSPQLIYDQEPSMVDDDDDETSKDKEIDKLMALISLSFKKIYKPTNNNLRTSLNTSRVNQNNSPRINKNAGYESQRSSNVAGARETVGSSMVQKSRIQ